MTSSQRVELRVLVIDDDEDDFIIAKDMIEEVFLGTCEVEWATNGSEGYDKLKGDDYDSCLLDVNLGDVNGIDLLKRCHDNGITIPIIVLTGQDDSDMVQGMDAVKMGAADYLSKAGITAGQISRSIRYAQVRHIVDVEKTERAKVEAESRAKSRFLANLSHELRSPLTSILGYSELLIRQANDIGVKKNVSVIKRNGEHLLSLINDVLDLSKIEADKIELDYIDVNLEKFITGVFKSMQIIALDKGIDLRVVFDNPLPVMIITDIIRLRQILINIINNAIKFTRKGHIELNISTQAPVDDEQDNSAAAKLQFSIKDTGTGIAQDKLSTIFSPFSQIDDDSAFTDGAGLGLAISRQLVEILGGDIWVESEEGLGSTFHFTVKAKLPEEVTFTNLSVIDNHIFENYNEYTASLNGIVLIVDDLIDVRNLISNFVVKTGAEVIFAVNGQEALDIVKSGKPIDIIFMDIQMPVMNGHEAALNIRAIKPDVYMCALTASSMKGDIQKCFDSGFDDFLSKPLDFPTFYNVLSSHLKPMKPIEETRKAHQSTVLIIDDNKEVLKITRALIEHLNWSVIVASSGSEARCIVQSDSGHYINLILMDIGLPDISADDLVLVCYEALPEIPVIMLSGQEPSASLLDNVNVVNSLLKPVTLAQLQQCLSQFETASEKERV